MYASSVCVSEESADDKEMSEAAQNWPTYVITELTKRKANGCDMLVMMVMAIAEAIVLLMDLDRVAIPPAPL